MAGQNDFSIFEYKYKKYVCKHNSAIKRNNNQKIEIYKRKITKYKNFLEKNGYVPISDGKIISKGDKVFMNQS